MPHLKGTRSVLAFTERLFPNIYRTIKPICKQGILTEPLLLIFVLFVEEEEGGKKNKSCQMRCISFPGLR